VVPLVSPLDDKRRSGGESQNDSRHDHQGDHQTAAAPFGMPTGLRKSAKSRSAARFLRCQAGQLAPRESTSSGSAASCETENIKLGGIALSPSPTFHGAERTIDTGWDKLLAGSYPRCFHHITVW
jgi:hypothetical protein